MFVKSISYVHDPEAAQKWFEIFVELIQEEILRDLNTPKVGQHSEEEPL